MFLLIVMIKAMFLFNFLLLHEMNKDFIEWQAWDRHRFIIDLLSKSMIRGHDSKNPKQRPGDMVHVLVYIYI